jgi:hypothetical protein
MTFAQASTRILGIGSLAFGAWGLVSPRSLTDSMGDDPSVGRLLGARDTAVGLALMSSAGPAALAARVIADASDAVRLRERSPRVALVAAAVTIWGLAAFLASRSASVSDRT